LLGAPQSNERATAVDDTCDEAAEGKVAVTSFQPFEKGCMWWNGNNGDFDVHVHIKSGEQFEVTDPHCSGLSVTGNPPGPGWKITSLYKDALGIGWQDWSWGSTRTIASTEKFYLGAKAIKVVFSS